MTFVLIGLTVALLMAIAGWLLERETAKKLAVRYVLLEAEVNELETEVDRLTDRLSGLEMAVAPTWIALADKPLPPKDPTVD